VRLGGRSRSFNITDVGTTNPKPVCDFLLVNKTDLHPVSRRFSAFGIAQYWSNYHLSRQGDASR